MKNLTNSFRKQVIAAMMGAVLCFGIALISLPFQAHAQSVENMTEAEIIAELEELIALVNALQAELEASSGSDIEPIPSTVCPYTWTRSLSIGDRGMDVQRLQRFLNQFSDTRVALYGEGSPGEETTYYGTATANAVSNFQVKYRDEILTPVGEVNPTGYFGPTTMAQANILCQPGTVYVEDPVAEETPVQETPVVVDETTSQPTPTEPVVSPLNINPEISYNNGVVRIEVDGCYSITDVSWGDGNSDGYGECNRGISRHQHTYAVSGSYTIQMFASDGSIWTAVVNVAYASSEEVVPDETPTVEEPSYEPQPTEEAPTTNETSNEETGSETSDSTEADTTPAEETNTSESSSSSQDDTSGSSSDVSSGGGEEAQTKYYARDIERLTRRDFYNDEAKTDLAYRKYRIALYDGTVHRVKRRANSGRQEFFEQLQATGYGGTLDQFQSKIIRLTPQVLGASISIEPYAQISNALVALEKALIAYRATLK